MKEKIRGTKFDSPGEVVEAFREEIFNTSDKKWANCFDMWFNHMKLCIDNWGGYFEKA